MPQPRKSTNSKPPPATNEGYRIETVLLMANPKLHVVRFQEPHDDWSDYVTNIYVKTAGIRKLGNPPAVKVTVEAFDPEA